MTDMEMLIRRVSNLIYVSMRHYVFLTTSGDIVVCFAYRTVFELLIC